MAGETALVSSTVGLSGIWSDIPNLQMFAAVLEREYGAMRVAYTLLHKNRCTPLGGTQSTNRRVKTR